MFFLLVRDGGREPAVRVEAADKLKIGRAPGNQLVLSDPNVGRVAAEIVDDKGLLFLVDLGSTNRTSIRGGRKLARGEREKLRHGMVIELGRSWIEIEEERKPDELTSPEVPTDPGDLTGLGFGDVTLVGSPPSSMPTIAGPRPVPPPADSDRTLLPARSERPAARPAPAARPPPAVRPMPAPEPERAPEPAPEPEPEPVPATPRAPARASAPPRESLRESPAGSRPKSVTSSTVDFLGPAGTSGGTQSIRPISGDLGSIGALITRRARLVIVNEALRRIDPITRESTRIGREEGEIKIDHRAISQPHALIRWVSVSSSFQIQDEKSRNQTVLGGVVLNPGVPQTLKPESLILFGPIEAIWVVDLDSENVKVPEEHYAGALRWLQSSKRVTAEQARAAQEEAKKEERHVGEALMMAGVIGAKDWARAFELGKNWQGSGGGGGLRLKLWIGLAVAAALAAGAWFLFKKSS